MTYTLKVKYKVLKEHIQGGYGQVWKVRKLFPNRKF